MWWRDCLRDVSGHGVQKNTGANVLAPDRIEVLGLDDDEPPGNEDDVCGGEEGLFELVGMEVNVVAVIIVIE